MKKLLIGTGLVLVLGVGGLVALPSLIPSSVYKERIEAQLEKELARDVTVSGDIKLSVFPVIKANAGRVVIDNPDGFASEHFAAMDGMSARIKLLPLLSKRVEISSFTLKNPQINLEKNASGVVNWAFGETDNTTEEADAGPFKRDGRYANLDPSIGAFILDNGAISYVDATQDVRHDLKDVNIAFSVPSLSASIKIDGDLVYNDMPADLDLELDSPRAFLDGNEAPVSLALKTDFTQLTAKGKFLAGENIKFNLDVTGDVSDVEKLVSLSPEPVPYAELVSFAKFDGNYNYDGSVLAVKGANISAKGPSFDAGFKGDATISEVPVLEGGLTFNATDIKTLAAAFEQEVQGLELLETATVTANFSAQDQGFSANDIVANLRGDNLTANYKGSAIVKDGTPTAQGTFSVDIPSVAKANEIAALNIDAANAIGSLTASGAVAFVNDVLTLQNLDAQTKGDVITGQYSGAATIGETPSYDGQFTANLASLTEFANRSGLDVPYADAIGTINVSGAVSGQGEVITLSTLDASLKDGQINGRYAGRAAYQNGLTLDGDLEADIPSLRALAATTGNNSLPPSTEAGDIYEAFAISGKVTGTPAAIDFNSAALSFDDFKGVGDFNVDLTKETPFVTGVLNIEGLDLRPYMAAMSAQNPTGEIQPWSEVPINVAPLKTVNGSFELNTPNIITDRLSLDQSNISAKLNNGVLVADMPNLILYGGLGRMDVTFDASNTVPSFNLDMNFDKLNTNKFLSAVAGFTNASGESGTAFTLSGRGTSQAEIMKSLSGSGDFKLIEGQISGVDLSELLTGLDQALTSRSLPGGIGQSYATKFRDIVGQVKIENGVASIDQFSLNGFGVLAEGAGQIDLGNQRLDFSLRPRLTGESASNLAAFGIPIQIAGNFGEASIGLDTDLIGKIAAERAKAKAAALIQDQVGGQLGSVLGGVLGSDTSSQGSSATSSNTDPVTNILGGLLGSKSNSETETSTPEPEKTEEKEDPKLEDQLFDLFGGKKNK